MLQLRSNLQNSTCWFRLFAPWHWHKKIVDDGQHWLLCFVHVRISLSSFDPRCTHLRGHFHEFYILNQTHLRGTQHNDTMWHKVMHHTHTYIYMCFLVQLPSWLLYLEPEVGELIGKHTSTKTLINSLLEFLHWSRNLKAHFFESWKFRLAILAFNLFSFFCKF